MNKKLFILGGILILALALALTQAFAKGETTKTAKAPTPAANTLAVCGCGKVFTPDANTLYLEVDGKQYACCTKACHEMASKDPKGTAALAEKATASKKAQIAQVDLKVPNVTAVTDKGTKALCGCGKHFTITENTKFLSYQGKSYACCTDECHALVSKDPPGAVKMFENQISGTAAATKK